MINGFQTFVVTKDTFIGVATAKGALKNRLVKAMASGTITFTFTSGTVVIPVSGGEDFAMDIDCVSVTSTAAVLMS